MNKRSLGVKIHKRALKAGVNLHTHSFRHYFATKLVERGATVRVVQELLGHSSLATTQVYLSVTADHLEGAIGLLDLANKSIRNQASLYIQILFIAF